MITLQAFSSSTFMIIYKLEWDRITQKNLEQLKLIYVCTCTLNLQYDRYSAYTFLLNTTYSHQMIKMPEPNYTKLSKSSTRTWNPILSLKMRQSLYA